jgi:iron complex transport system permease protein
LGALGVYSIPLFAFLGAVATLGAVVYLSAGSGGLSSNNLILSGIIVAAILSAGISFLKYVADEQVAVIIFWLMGSFSSKTWGDVGLTAAFIAAGASVFIFFARELNLMSLGNQMASSLGVDTRRVTLILLTTASVVAAVCVSVSGIIGFVGLLVPHSMRLLSGPDNRRLVPLSFLAGALLLLGADTLTRAVLPVEIPIGVLTALIGGPFFCYVFRRQSTGKAW